MANVLSQHETYIDYFYSQLTETVRPPIGVSDKWLYAEGPGFSGTYPE